jgi:hypothetical protein
VGNLKMNLSITLIFASILISVNAQTVELNKIKLNRTIPYSLNIEELKSKVKKFDSIKSIPETMDMLTADSLVYIGKTYFEFSNDSQNCSVKVIYFDKRITELNIGQLTLTEKTTEKDISKYFENDCSLTEHISIYGESERYNSCELPITLNGKVTDSRLLLFFLNGKLKRIDLWKPS